MWIPLGHCVSRLRLPFHRFTDHHTDVGVPANGAASAPAVKRGRGRPRKADSTPPTPRTSVAMTSKERGASGTKKVMTCMCRGQLGQKRDDISGALLLQCDKCSSWSSRVMLRSTFCVSFIVSHSCTHCVSQFQFCEFHWSVSALLYCSCASVIPIYE